MRVLAFCLVFAAVSGCVQEPAPDPAPAPAEAVVAPAREAQLEFRFEPEHPKVGEHVGFFPQGSHPEGDEIVAWSWVFGDGATADTSIAAHRYEAPGNFTVAASFETASGLIASAQRALTVSVPLPAPNATEDGTAPPPDPFRDLLGMDEPAFPCDGETVQEEDWTHGHAETAAGALTWAVLKTGFRFVAVLEAAEGDLEYSLDGGEWQTDAPLLSGDVRVFIMDGLPKRSTMCFRVAGTEDVHAVRLANAWNAFDPRAQAYVLNTLSLANEAPAQQRILDGTADYGDRFYDATDGWIQSGRHIVLFGDWFHHNSGWASCYMALGLSGIDAPTCVRLVDVIYTNDAFAAGAASTYKDAIADPAAAIWMNWYFQGAPYELDDTGAVLVHEMGHYALAALDLYVGDESCWDEENSLSVMGSSRDATEFDDELHPCPDAETIPDYVPTWTLMQERFKRVEDRGPSIDPGPATSPGNHVHGYTVF